MSDLTNKLFLIAEGLGQRQRIELHKAVYELRYNEEQLRTKTLQWEGVKDMLATANITIEHLQEQILELKMLLTLASCPQCDGSGAYYDNMGNIYQCQWCHEVKQALDSDE